MWHVTKIIPVNSFTFDTYLVDENRSIITFTYKVEFKFGITKTFTDKLYFKEITPEMWKSVPATVLEPTLQALLLIIGINYWSAFRTNNIKIKNFSLTQEQAKFWDSLYLQGLSEFFYIMKIDFRNLIAFPYDITTQVSQPSNYKRPARTLLLNGAGKDSIVSAELLKLAGVSFDFFTFSPTPAHFRIAKLVNAKTVSVTRKRDLLLNIILVGTYPSVTTYTFISLLLAELLGYNTIITSNEKSADFGNTNYLGLDVNHQWCKSTQAEEMINHYIKTYITKDITTSSLLRKYSELEIVQKFVNYPQYFNSVTSCNSYFWLPSLQQKLMKSNYWCGSCPKCIFLFACFASFLPKQEVIKIFGANLFTKKKLLPVIERILGVKGFKPLDCVGEPEEMIFAMHLVRTTNEYSQDDAILLFNTYFSLDYNFDTIKSKVFTQ